MKKVYLGIPTYDGRVGETIVNRTLDGQQSEQLFTIHISTGSLLTRNFNLLYSSALNARKKGVTHFLLMHEDVAVQKSMAGNWIDVFLAIAEREKADILSAVIPIKTHQGLTSTALDEAVDPKLDRYWRPRRLTMHEICADYPLTFTHPNLLVNTGLMLVDLRNDWAEKLWFENEDRIVPDPLNEGMLTAVTVPEDWNFSRRARAFGAKLCATRELAVLHIGQQKYPNTNAWGTLKCDA